LDDGVGTSAVLYDLVEVAAQRVHQFGNFQASFIVDRNALQGVLQFIDQFARDTGEIVDEIERVFDLVRDTRSELAERCQFLCLDEAILRGPQIFQCSRQLARAILHAFEQPDILDRDHRLVGECLDELDLLVAKGPRISALQGEDADDGSFTHQRNAESAAYVDDTGEILKPNLVEVGIGQKIGNMGRAAVEYGPPENRSPVGLGRVAYKVVALFCGKAES